MTVNVLELNGGTISKAGTLNIASSLIWENKSTIAGPGKTIIEASASATIEDPGILRDFKIAGGTLINNGIARSGTLAALSMSEGALLRNNGTIAINDVVGESDGSIINYGKFEKNEGSVTKVEVPFENYGAIDAMVGEIVLKYPVVPARSTQYGKRNLSALGPAHPSCGKPVDCITGNETETQNDIAVAGRGVPLDLTRYYNAQAGAVGEHGVFGYGWTSSFSDRMVYSEVEKTARVVQANGSTVTFAEEGGVWVAPAWTQDALTGGPEAGWTLTMSDQTVYKFAGGGRLESVTDRNGNATSLAYNEAGQLTGIEGAGGRKITLAYNAEGLVESATDPMGHVVTYGYEGGNLASVTMPGEEAPRWRFKYDASHRMTMMIDGRGGETINEYDGESRVVKQTDPMGHVLKWAYEAFKTTITNEATGAVTVEGYDSADDLTAITHGYGTEDATTEELTYNERGETLTRTDGNGNTTSFEYDSAGDKVKETDPEGHETEWTYNAQHQVTSETLPGGEQTSIEYDEHGNPIKVARPAPEEKTQETKYEYNTAGQPTVMIDPLGHKWAYGYDEAGDRTSETDPEGDKTTWGYDEDGRVVSEVGARGNVEGGEPSKYTTSTERDAQGRPVKVSGPEGQETLYEYDANGDLVAVTDPNAHKTVTTYDADGQPTKVTAPNGSVTETGYNGAGQVISQTDANEHTTSYVRNVLGQVVEVIDPLEHKTIKTYDGAGNLKTLTDAEGRISTYSYNKQNQLTKIAYSEEGMHAVEYEYNADGQRTAMIDATGTTSYSYNQLGEMTETKDGHGDTVGYGYDLAGQQTSITYPNGKTVERSYDKAGRLSGVTDWLGHTIGFSYDPASLLTGESFPEAAKVAGSYAYNRAGQMTEAAVTSGTETLASIAYTRDPAGQVTSEAQEGLPDAASTEYGYDENERITSAGTTGYEYDGANNPTKLGETTQTFNAADQLTEAGSTTYAYNTVGQRTKATPTGGPATSYGYDQAGNMTTVSRPEEGETAKIEDSYAYNGDGLRTSQTESGTTSYLIWELSGGLPLLLDDGTHSYIYGPNGLPIEQISTTEGKEEAQYLHHDQQGSTRLITGEEGGIQGTYSYSPYGEISGHTGSAVTTLGYDGQYMNAGTNTVYLRARNYDPKTAQFMSVDPAVAITRQSYAYAEDNPLSSGDPLGLCNANPFSESFWTKGNCVSEGAEKIGVAEPIEKVVTAAPVVDGAAGLVCVGAEEICPLALDAALSISSAQVALHGAQTCWENPGELAAEEAINVSLFGAGRMLNWGAGLAKLGPVAKAGLSAPMTSLQAGYDATQVK